MNKLETIQSKILSGKCLDRMLAYWKFKTCKVVFTNGCFDIMHLGHVDYLARASDLGDILVVGLNTDRSVRAIKGLPRPLQDQNSRSILLASLSFVNAVILFDQETPVELIKKIKPDILVKGNDYKPEEIIGAGIVAEYGGKVLSLPVVDGYSTSNISKKMI